jgi:hypothetical protein
MIAPSRQPTSWTLMPTVRKFLLDSLTAQACLACPGRVDFYHSASGAFCLGAKFGNKSRPSGIVHGLGEETPGHSLDVQIFDCNKTVQRHQPEGYFVVEVRPLISDVRMNSLKFTNCLASAARTSPTPRDLALCSAEFGLRFPIMSRLVDFCPVRKHDKRLQAQVDADRFIAFRQGARFNFATETSIPTTRFPFNGAGLDLTHQGTVQFDFNTADFGQCQASVFNSKAQLRVAKRVVARSRSETWEAWILTCFATAKESAKRFVDAVKNILQNLAVNFLILRPNQVDLWKLAGLFVEPYRRTTILPRSDTLLKSGIVEFTAQTQRLLQAFGLVASWINPVFIRSSAVRHIALSPKGERRQPSKRNNCASKASAGGNVDLGIPAAKYERISPSIDALVCGCRTVDRPRLVDAHGLALFPVPEHRHEVPEQRTEAHFSNGVKCLRSIRVADTSGTRPHGTYSNRQCAGSICILLRGSRNIVYSMPLSNEREKRGLISSRLKAGALRPLPLCNSDLPTTRRIDLP